MIKAVITPNAERTGNFPMFNGTLNLLFLLSLYLRKIFERLTKANVMKRNNVVMSATNSMFSTNAMTRVIAPTIITAQYGVLLVLWTKERNLGKDFSFAMPYANLEVVTTVIKTVFEVENKAIIARRMNANGPKDAAATSANGLFDCDKV